MSVKLSLLGFLVLAVVRLSSAGPPSTASPRLMPPMKLNFRKNPQDASRTEVRVAVYINESDCECLLDMEPCFLELVIPDDEVKELMISPCAPHQRYCCKMNVNMEDIVITNKIKEKVKGPTSAAYLNKETESESNSKIPKQDSKTTKMHEYNSTSRNTIGETVDLQYIRLDDSYIITDDTKNSKPMTYQEESSINLISPQDSSNPPDVVASGMSVQEDASIASRSSQQSFDNKASPREESIMSEVQKDNGMKPESRQELPVTLKSSLGLFNSLEPRQDLPNIFETRQALPLSLKTYQDLPNTLEPQTNNSSATTKELSSYIKAANEDNSYQDIFNSRRAELYPHFSSTSHFRGYNSEYDAYQDNSSALGSYHYSSSALIRIPVVKRDVRKAERQHKTISTAPQISRESKMIMCSCKTRDDCLSTWSFFRDLPKVNIKTTIRCEGPGEVTCCFGEIIPPRNFKTLPDFPLDKGDIKKKNNHKAPNDTLLNPSLTAALQNVFSWLLS